MKCLLNQRRRAAASFRPLDVAAIVAVVLALAALTILTSGRIRERALRSQCRLNLQQIGRGFALYADAHGGLLPDCSPMTPRFTGAAWPWDMHTNLVNVLMAGGATRDTLYCPANPDMNDDRHWNFWKANPGPLRIVGYPALLGGLPQVPSTLWRPELRGSEQAPASETELAFDATAALDDDYTRIEGLWTDRSNHMKGDRPLGGNILFLDQHVEWRDFGDMETRFSTFAPAGLVYWDF